MKKRLSVLLGSLLAVTSALPAKASVPTWKLMPVEGFSQREFAKDETVVRLRMVPAVLYELDADYLQDNGRVAAPKGTQLIGLRGLPNAACAIFPPKLALGAAIFAWGADRHLCFVDDNADGKFDSYYFRQANEAGFYNLIESMPKKRKVGTGGAYSLRGSDQMTRNLDWVVRFGGCKLKSKGTADPVRKICTIGINLEVPGFSGTSAGSMWTTYGRSFGLDLTSGPEPIDFFGVRMQFEGAGSDKVRVSLTQDPQIKPFLLL